MPTVSRANLINRDTPDEVPNSICRRTTVPEHYSA
jgi:hypothetical protein